MMSSSKENDDEDLASSSQSMPILSISSPEILRNCRDLTDSQDGMKTLFIASYPKSGTTWMQAIVYNLLSNGNQCFGHISDFSPFFEVKATWDTPPSTCISDKYYANHRSLNWRVFNTHLLWEMMPKCERMYYIYVVRNGRDVALSFFQHLSNQNDADCFEGTFAEFLKEWCEGRILFGKWAKHLQSWFNAAGVGTAVGCQQEQGQVLQSPPIDGSLRSRNPKILLVSYEDLTKDPLQVMQNVARHLDLPVSVLSHQRVEELLPFITFEYMKSHSRQYQPISVPWKPGFSFIRQGKVGGSAEYMDEQCERMFMEMVQREFGSLAQAPQWLQDMCTAVQKHKPS